MTAAISLSWPGSRVLAGWWPLLQRWQPRALWLHHLQLHRVDALVAVSGSLAIDRLNLLLLESLTCTTPESLAPQLGLEVALLRRLLAELQGGGLIVPDGKSWQLTDAGREVLAGQRDSSILQQRRTFYFAEGDARHPGTRFLPLENPPSTPVPQSEDWHFDVQTLRSTLARDADWKRIMGFPQDVKTLLELEGTDDWRRVVLERAEQLLLALVLGEDEHVRGFAVQSPTWTLQGEEPILELAAGWREALPELTDEIELSEWRQAFRVWGQPRALPPGELEACVLERQGPRLRVIAPQPMIERLRTARSDALKGEAWLLAGSDRARAAALIDLREDGQPRCESSSGSRWGSRAPLEDSHRG